jgi:hypothetical protein
MSDATDTYAAAIVAGDLDAAVAAYRSADTGDKARMRAHVADAAKTAIMAGDLAGAQFALSVQDAQSVKVATATVVDWNDRVARRVAVLIAAGEHIMSGTYAPAGLPDDVVLDFDVIRTAVNTYAGDQSVSDDGAKLAVQSVGRGTVAMGGDIAAHVVQALELVDGEFQTVAQIRAAVTPAYDGDQRPSAGAISARLFPRDGSDCTIEGVVPVPATATAPNGARLDG